MTKNETPHYGNSGGKVTHLVTPGTVSGWCGARVYSTTTTRSPHIAICKRCQRARPLASAEALR
jgi:hypothetical protein